MKIYGNSATVKTGLQKKGLDRNSSVYMIKGVLAESPERPWPTRSIEELQAHTETKHTDCSAQIFKLPQPILCVKDDIRKILQFSKDGRVIRIYPLFELNSVAENSGTFKDVNIPDGHTEVEKSQGIISSVPPCLVVTPTGSEASNVFCQGLRIDCGGGINLTSLAKMFLEQICQFTHQWWLRSSTSPFNGMLRFGAGINKDFSLRSDLKYSGAGEIESTWFAARETQELLGIEIPLDNFLWSIVGRNVANGQKACSGIIAFHDALAAYMSQDDNRCILNLCICFEILGNKRRLMTEKKPVTFSKLLSDTSLAPLSDRTILKKMFIDRGHIVHGRELHILGSKPDVKIEDYVEATRVVLSRYLRGLNADNWPTASQMSIGRPKVMG